MKNNSSRIEWENRIVQRAEAINLLKENASWLNDEEVDAFLESWYDLKRFYEEDVDTEFGISVLREYVHFTRLIRRILSDNNIPNEIRQKAQASLDDIEYYIDEIIREGVSNIENQDH
jgi:hypothetical protein